MTKTIKIPFAEWKGKSKKFNGLPVHISMDGATQKVTVTAIKTK